MTNIPIFLASDDNYAPFVATTIASICDNTNSFIDFYILDGGITTKNQERIEKLIEKFNNFSIDFINIDTEKEFKEFKTTSYISMAAYNRFLIPQLKPNLKKVIYLDIDIIVLGDIKELYEQSLDGFAVGTIDDQGDINFISQIKNNLDMDINCTYFNSGVLLMDLNKWNEDKIVETLFKIEEKYREKILCNDQDILNKYFENNYKLLDKKFNTMIKGDNAIIRHFANVFKPWNYNFFKIGNQIRPLENFDDFWHYADITDFNNEIKQKYEHNINSNILNKRMSIIAEKMKQGE
jgi:lipopolysaccharide biosynthesis glycosyltransferase